MPARIWPDILAGGGHLPQVVDHPDGEDDRGAEDQADRVGVAPEDGLSPCSCEATTMATRKPRYMAAPPTVGVGPFVYPPVVGQDDDREPDRQAAHDEGAGQGGERGHQADDHVVAIAVDAQPPTVLRVRRELGTQNADVVADGGGLGLVVRAGAAPGR